MRTSEHDGSTYYQTLWRGVAYTAHEAGSRWFVATHRLALGRHHIGGGRYYDSLQELSIGCKAFAGPAALLGLPHACV
ncbi:hypothetical protein [Paraburkholderia strydomiana]|uniref:hypothetical protein n=1 Tax=Paraburkholderia strydomiana TaxID=1245417 RepID=UPI001BE5956D|nr:hypothetical protein [Paraburkholderia strydomiana]MBT2793820.1 hypothetical protein [Paraburkholderia strydomiana]